MAVLVNVDNFVRAETHRMFADIQRVASADGDLPANAIVTPEGWNYLIRLYRPRAEIFDGSWTPPILTPCG
jgi:hypothetical protein